MPPPETANGAPAKRRRPPITLTTAATAAEQGTGLSSDRITDPARQLLAWREAVEHLHALGLPAAVPEFPAAWLCRQGIRPDWETAA